MKRDERQTKIMSLIESQGSVEVSELAKLFGVSEMSIRSDLNALAEEGKLKRIYGGANKNTHINMEMPLLEKQARNRSEKALIGKAAAGIVTEGDSIMVEAGTTTEQVARCLVGMRELTVITNGLNIVTTLLPGGHVRLYTVGGEVSEKSYSIVGTSAERALEEYYAKLCILGADAVDLMVGLTDNSYEATNVVRAMMKRSKRKILVCDSSKIGHVALIPVCGIEEIDVFVTDAGAPADFLERVREKGVEVVIAEA